MNKINKRQILQVVKYSFSIIFIVGLVYYLFLKKDPRDLINSILSADLYLILLSMIFAVISLINRGLRSVILIESLGHECNKINSISAVSSGYFMNYLFARVGEVTRCTALNQTEGIPVDKLFGTVVLERVIDMLMVLFFLTVSLILNFDHIYQFFLKTEIGDFKFSSNTYYLVISSLILFYITYKLINKSKIYKKMLNFISGIKQGFASIKNIERKWEFWIHTISIWLMYFLMTYICFGSIEETSSLGLSDGVFLLVIGAISMTVPLPAMAGFIPSVMLGLSILGIGEVCDAPFDCHNIENPSYLFAIILYASQTLVLIATGILGFIILFLSRKKVKNG